MISALLVLAIARQDAPVVPATWSVNPHHTVIWGSQPWLPVGARISGSPENVEKCVKAGISDAIVELPADGTGWAPTLTALRESGIRYMIAISSGSPTTHVVAVEPEGYRLANLQGPIKETFRIPGAESALVILASNRDRSIRWERRLPVVDGTLTVEDPRGPGSLHTLLIYPVVKDLRTADHWETFDQYRDRLLGALKSNDLGPGFRGLLNPLGSIARFTPTRPEYVPTSSMFQIELESFLTQKYGSFETALKSWSMGTNDLQSFRDLSKLVPLWSGDRGVDVLWNPETNRTYRTDMKVSSAWRDISEVLRSSAYRRYNRLVQGIKQVVNCPVLQDWNGWNGPYEMDDTGLDGVAFSGDDRGIIPLIDAASRPVSSVMRHRKSMLALASDIRLERTEGRISAEVARAELEGIGVRGWYFRCRTPEDWAEAGALAKAVAADSSPSEWHPDALFYPEAARDPAVPARILGGLWWLPAPGSGDRLDFGPEIQGYRYFDSANNFLVLWATEVPTRLKFRVQNPKDISFEQMDGTPVEIRSRKNEIELILPTEPIIMRNPKEIPVPVLAYERTVALVDGLIQKFGNRIDTAGNETYFFRDAVQSYERNPGGGFTQLQQQLDRLLMRASPYSWMEAESTVESNFGMITPVEGISSGKALSIRTRLAPPASGYYARFYANAMTAGPQEIWIAARIPESARDTVQVMAGNQVVTITQGPVSFYGPGFGWYRLGNLNLTSGRNQLALLCGNADGAEMDIDVVLATPPGFQPMGPRLPSGWIIDLLKADPVKPERGSGGGGTLLPIPAPLRHTH